MWEGSRGNSGTPAQADGLRVIDDLLDLQAVSARASSIFTGSIELATTPSTGHRNQPTGHRADRSRLLIDGPPALIFGNWTLTRWLVQVFTQPVEQRRQMQGRGPDRQPLASGAEAVVSVRDNGIPVRIACSSTC
jgi:hypothetical protein